MARTRKKQVYQLQAWSDLHKDWVILFHETSKAFCEGYLERVKEESAPAVAHRIVRDDGSTVDHSDHCPDEVSLGMVAGFPTPEQYEDAGRKAINRAKAIRDTRKKYLESKK